MGIYYIPVPNHFQPLHNYSTRAWGGVRGEARFGLKTTSLRHGG
jgi:hypothetical protein